MNLVGGWKSEGKTRSSVFIPDIGWILRAGPIESLVKMPTIVRLSAMLRIRADCACYYTNLLEVACEAWNAALGNCAGYDDETTSSNSASTY